MSKEQYQLTIKEAIQMSVDQLAKLYLKDFPDIFNVLMKARQQANS